MLKTINSLNNFLKQNSSVAPVVIRIMTGFHLVYVTKEAAFSAIKMKGVISFFTSQQIPASSLLAPLALYSELICGILLILGLMVRPAAGIMVFVFICAISFVHIADSYTSTFPAIVMLAGALSLLFSGAGKYSIDYIIQKHKKNNFSIQ